MMNQQNYQLSVGLLAQMVEYCTDWTQLPHEPPSSLKLRWVLYYCHSAQQLLNLLRINNLWEIHSNRFQNRLDIFFPNRYHVLPLFISSNILTINLLYFETVLIFMHDVVLDSVPLNLKNLFRSSIQVHSHNTRFSSAGNYYINPSRTIVMEFYF